MPAWEPMGLAFKDYLKGRIHTRIFNYCVFGNFPVPVSIYFRGWEEFPEIEHYALSLCEGTILDIGAGSGCHSLALAEQGKDVTALDISPLNVEVMHAQGLQKVIGADVFNIQEAQYDTLLMLMNGIGFVGDLEGLGKFLDHAHQLIQPYGQIIFDATDLMVIHPRARSINAKRAYYGSVEYYMSYREVEGAPFDWLFVDEATLAKYCNKTGWYMQKIFQDDDGHYLVRLKSEL